MSAKGKGGKRPPTFLVGDVGTEALPRVAEAGRYTRAVVCSLALHVAGVALGLGFFYGDFILLEGLL